MQTAVVEAGLAGWFEPAARSVRWILRWPREWNLFDGPASAADLGEERPGSAFRDRGGEQVAQLVADHRSGGARRHPPCRRVAIGERRVHLAAVLGVQLPRQQQPAQP
jgi:hypothetical protein